MFSHEHRYHYTAVLRENLIVLMTTFSHQVADVNNAGDFASRRRGLPGRANGIIDGDGNARFLLADGATDEGVAGGHWDKELTVNIASPLLHWNCTWRCYTRRDGFIITP